ncbi:MAG: UDP-N-acetylmuramate dehydrogenase [Treponema sp.]|nr:UDP-N-acetylmuramate dehydrogenase [Treponema sp.]
MNSIEQIAEKFKSKKIGLFFEEELSARSSFKIGGKAALLAEPSDEESLAFALTETRNAKIPYFILGGGTNVLFDDSGFDGIVVSTKKLAGISVEKDVRVKPEHDAESSPVIPALDAGIFFSEASSKAIIRAAAGESVAALVSFAEREGLAGLEEFAGLPGTVGGAVYMNARCFDREMSDVAAKITWLEWTPQDGSQAHDGSEAFRVKSAVFAPSDWDYKKSPFTGTGRVVLSAEFIVQKGDKASIAQKAAAFIQERKDKGHYKAPCAGSVFKNNRAFGRPTGKIIDELGLKGERRGGAQIAPFHGNIIINAGGAKASDVLALVELCKTRAKEKFGFDLEEEIVLA